MLRIPRGTCAQGDGIRHSLRPTEARALVPARRRPRDRCNRLVALGGLIMAAQVFLLPDLGEGLTEAVIVRWMVSVGDKIAIDQAIAEVETAKSIVELPSPYAGTVLAL